MISGVAEQLSVDPELLDDLKTAVSEACNNVVRHAYPPGETGPLSVELYVLEDSVVASVQDQGVGIAAHEQTAEQHPGVGISVIQALAERTEWGQSAQGGTEVFMTFAGVRDGQRLFQPLTETIPEDGWATVLDGDAVASISPLDLLGGVLGRLARALAAMARFSLDRFADVYLVTDAVAAHASAAASARRIAFALTADSHRLELSVGPLEQGSGAWIGREAELMIAPSPLTLLSDQLLIDSLPGDRELLRIVMIDRRA